jgi:hypothetical protein
MKKEFITHEKQDEDAWVCICGNTPVSDGFFPCNADGTVFETWGDNDWEGELYCCDSCGRVIDQWTLEVKASGKIVRGSDKVIWVQQA